MDLMNLGSFTWDGMVKKQRKRVAGKKVDTLMTKDVITVKEDATLMDVR